MPLTFVPPKPGRTPYWRVRGTYLGIRVDRSTKTGERKVAFKLLAAWKDDIERGCYARPGDPTFAAAALTYMQAGGERRFVGKLLDRFGERLLASISQADVDAAALAIYPRASAATRNRQVYSPVSAIMKRAGLAGTLRRPAGARGQQRLSWLRPEEATRLLGAANGLSARFGALCTFLLYTGCRLSEALRLRPADLCLQESLAFVPQTKNGEPRAVHLPPVLIAALAGLDLGFPTVFRLSKCGRLYELLEDASGAAGVDIPDRVAFHLFRHTYGAWMRRYGGLDTAGLVATGAWKDRSAAAVYEHVDVTEEARKADLLPTGTKNGRTATE
jgi:integrase